jgi:hypothetical protein
MDEWVIDILDRASLDAGLTHAELDLRYFELGAMSDALQVEALCYGTLQPDHHDHDVVAHALNERFSEIGRNRLILYSDDTRPRIPGNSDLEHGDPEM